MKTGSVVLRRLVLILLMAALPQAAFAQDEGGAANDYLPLILGDNDFSMLYPADWILDENNQDAIVFASQEDLFVTTPETVFAEGDVWVAISLFPTDNRYDSDNSLMITFANYLTDTLLTQFNGEMPSDVFPTLPEILPSSDGGTEIARQLISNGAIGDAALYFWQLSDRVSGVLYMISAADEIETHELNVITMIQSASLSDEFVALFLAASEDQ